MGLVSFDERRPHGQSHPHHRSRSANRHARTATREPRYWQNGHPEREGFTAWVRGGFGALHPKDAPARGAVWVRPYRREGKPVAGHWRSAPPGGTGSSAGAIQPGTIQYANWRRSLWERLTRGPADGRRPNNNERRNQRPTMPPPAAPEDEVGRRIDTLLRDGLTAPHPTHPDLDNGGFQWVRDGGPSLRDRDVEGLRPSGEARRDRNALIYPLDQTRQIVVRVSTTQGEPPWPTLDVQERYVRSNGSSGFRTIHKFRYKLSD